MVFSVSAVLLAAADPAAKPAQKLAVPPGAVATAPSTWRFTDAQGNKWIYHTSPFGITREREGAARPVTPEFDNVKAVEDGDVIRFERPTPFGPLRWQTKKPELNEMERSVWNREQARRAGSAAAQE